ncbi:MAG: hypothetical protein IIA67_12580, partial [Planctomycetes bacterium]|nr:hypothetical protein [Planctomycetota bacterium]
MRFAPPRVVWFSGLLFALLAASVAAAAEKKPDLSKLPPAAKTKVGFVEQIQPIFKKTCYS